MFDRGKYGLDVLRHSAAPHHGRPNLDWRIRDERLSQANVSKVVVQVRPPPTVQRVTGCPNAWPTFAPSTRAPEVVPALVGQKHIRPMIQPLKSTLQSARTACERRQIGSVRDGDQQVDIFGRRLRRHDRADERDSPNASNGRNRTDKSQNTGQHLLANRVRGQVTLHSLRQRPEDLFLFDRFDALIKCQPVINGLPAVRVPKIRQVKAAPVRVL